MSGLRAARHSPSRHAVTGPGRQIRPQLVRASVLPTLAAALSGAAAVIFTLQLGGGAGERDARLWPVLTGCALLVLGALAAALLGAQRGAKAVRDRCEALRRSSVRGRQELRTAAERLERGETPPRPVRGGPNGPPPAADPAGVDEFWLLAQELRGAREQAHTTLVRLALPAAPSDSDRKVEVFVNLARRLQSLVHREISLLDDLEDTVEDPDLLKELFHVDHLATRIRRHAENLAVLGGAASRRQWTRPIDLSEVLRSSVAEVEQYTRVKVVPPAGGTVRGHAVADVVHLLAELVENATVFSAPDTDVVVRAERVTSGIAVEVEDRGLGMPAEEQHRMNALLGDPDQVSVRHLLADGRIGLYVVSALARRHGIAVELKSNIYGGVLAVLVLPQGLLGAEAPAAADAMGGSRATSWGTGEGSGMGPLEPVRVNVPGSWPEGERDRPAPPPWPPAAPPRTPEPRPATGPSRTPEPRPDTGPEPWPGVGAATGPGAGAVSRQDTGARPGPWEDAGPGREHGSWADAGPGPGLRQGAGSGGEPGSWASAGPEPWPGVGPQAVPPGPAAPASAVAPSAPVAPAAPNPAPHFPAVPPGEAARAVPGRAAPEAGGPDREMPAPGAPAPGTPAVAAPGFVVSVPVVPDREASAPVAPGGPRRQEQVPAAPGGAVAVPAGFGRAVPGPAGRDVAAASGIGREGFAPAGATGRGGTGPEVALVPFAPGQRGPVPDRPTTPEAGERPPLPRRRAQQHLAPQLREAPAPRRAADTEPPVHDPGLMAAFQRGFGLAQSEPQA
ncbi:ATP-binding protein [Streptomyces sp. NBC_00249]|uniref:sensor histidine kinase n=1 Tax=Streptomyces sp. NBC_00249 TaxID=2975690 RepID=UPI00225327F9|nr:ATP-binding protein [Streptomyces sp. NBC_00249]MCX5193334.1 ATP-binding protein [Streptomyces sp. NBC_00249]